MVFRSYHVNVIKTACMHDTLMVPYLDAKAIPLETIHILWMNQGITLFSFCLK